MSRAVVQAGSMHRSQRIALILAVALDPGGAPPSLSSLQVTLKACVLSGMAALAPCRVQAPGRPFVAAYRHRPGRGCCVAAATGEQLYCGIDYGTSGARCCVIDR